MFDISRFLICESLIYQDSAKYAYTKTEMFYNNKWIHIQNYRASVTRSSIIASRSHMNAAVCDYVPAKSYFRCYIFQVLELEPAPKKPSRDKSSQLSASRDKSSQLLASRAESSRTSNVNDFNKLFNFVP